jgi:hypothetical protein
MVSWAQPTPEATTPVPPSQVVDLSVLPNARQRRWTAALRLLLAVPHLFVLFFLGLAASVVVVIGWFGALFTGRLPGFAAEYLSGYVRWSVRVHAYLYFLTDRYPPFSFDPEPEYAVRLAIRPGRLNRWAVFFRIILVIPAYVVLSVVTSGATLVSIVSWAATWITARLPEPFYEAFRVVVRLEARFWAYLGMLSSEYPWWGMFGDEAPIGATTVPPPGYYPGAWASPAPSSYPPSVTTEVPPPPPPPSSPSPPSSAPPPPAYPPPPAGYPPPPVGYPPPPPVGYPPPPPVGYPPEPSPPSPEPPPAYEPSAVSEPVSAAPAEMPVYPEATPGAPPGFEGQSVADPFGRSEPSWLLPVRGGGRALLIIMIVLGILSSAANGAINVWVGTKTTAIQARDDTTSAYNTLVDDINHYSSTVESCSTLPCARNAASQAGDDLGTFSSTISGIDYPAAASDDAAQLESSALSAQQTFVVLSHVNSGVAFGALSRVVGNRLDAVESDYHQLVDELNQLG